MTSAGSGRRRAELAENLTALRARVATACEAAGRDVGEISVVAVTKTWPASDVRLLAELGVSDIGENRDQEAAPKAAECADLALTWHFVGQIQTNKCRSVVGYADVVQSVDRPRLARVLAKEARRAGRVVTCLVQVDLDDEGRADRGGAAPTGQRGGVRPATAGGVPQARGGGSRDPGNVPGRGGDLGRYEWGSRGGHRIGRDTPARRYGVARRQARLRQVMSRT